MRCSKSLLKNKEQSREPKATVYPWSCNRKTKPHILHWSFKISFIVFINTLFTNQHSSLRIKPQTLTLILLDFFQKIEPILIMNQLYCGENILGYYWFCLELQYLSWARVKVNWWLAIEHAIGQPPPMSKFKCICLG